MDEKRKLIKFSNYSLCITLPKSVTTKLKWKKGDTIMTKINEKQGEIILTKELISSEKDKPKPKAKLNKGKKTARW